MRVSLDLAPPQIITRLRAGNTGSPDVASTKRLTAPMELPTKWADSTPTALQNRAMCLIRMPRPSLKSMTFAEPPNPSMSGASTRWCGASAAMFFSHPISALTPNSPP